MAVLLSLHKTCTVDEFIGQQHNLFLHCDATHHWSKDRTLFTSTALEKSSGNRGSCEGWERRAESCTYQGDDLTTWLCKVCLTLAKWQKQQQYLVLCLVHVLHPYPCISMHLHASPCLFVWFFTVHLAVAFVSVCALHVSVQSAL